MSPRFMNTRQWLTILAALACFSSGGCLVFENQKLVFSFSPDGNEVRALFVYEGLRVSGSQEADLQRARDELEALLTKQEDFYILHALFHVSLAPPKPDAKEDERSKEGRALLQKHIRIAPGVFYLTKDGRLCATQTLTIRDAQRFTAGLNDLISLQLDQAVTETLSNQSQPKDSLSEETLRLIQKAAREKFAWVKLEPGRLSFTLPGDAAAFADFKRSALRSMLVKDLEMLADPPRGTPQKTLTSDDIRKKARDFDRMVAALAVTPISIDQRRDRMTISLGVGQGEPLRLTFPDEPEPSRELTKLDQELIAHARTLKVEFKENATTEGVIAEFLGRKPN